MEFAKKYPVVGFDVNSNQVEELRNGFDHTLEIEDNDLKKVISSNHISTGLNCTNKIADIIGCNYYTVTVPTPMELRNCLNS